MIMELFCRDSGIFGERELAPGIKLCFVKWAHDGHKSLYISHDKDVVFNIADYNVTNNFGVISGVYKDGYYFNELSEINEAALRFEIDCDKLLLYYPLQRIIKAIKKRGVTYTRKIELEVTNNE